MAAARCAARRLGGSLLHRSQAAVAEERRQLVPRRFLSGDQGRVFRQYPMDEIQQKKEELFTLMSEADRDYVGERQNIQLMRYLCEHVEPRPDDPHWRRFRREQLVTNWITLLGPMSCMLATLPFFMM